MKQLKWKIQDDRLTTNIPVKTLNSKYNFDVFVDITFDKKVHEEYSFVIEWNKTDLSHKIQISGETHKTKKSEKTLSFNKCSSWIIAEIRKIIEKDLLKADATYNSIVNVLSELTLTQDYYANNQTIKAPKCKK